MSLVTIVEQTAPTFPYSPKDPDTNLRSGTVFHVRMVPEKEQKRFRKVCTKAEFQRGQKVDVFDGARYTEMCLDYAIVDWEKVESKRIDKHGQVVEVVQIPCTPENKTKLPDFVRIDITRICVGKEAARYLWDDEAVGDDDSDDRAPASDDGEAEADVEPNPTGR